MTEPERLTTAQAARLLGVDASTVRRYANAGLLTPERTARGHRRYSEAEVLDLRRRTT